MLNKDDVISIIRVLILGLFGIGITILFIYLYHRYDNLVFTITTAFLSLIYMIGCIIYLILKENINLGILKTCILFPLIYLIIVFIVLIFVEQNTIKENPIRVLDCFMWAVYAMPAFIIVILLLLLILWAISYSLKYCKLYKGIRPFLIYTPTLIMENKKSICN